MMQKRILRDWAAPMKRIAMIACTLLIGFSAVAQDQTDHEDSTVNGKKEKAKGYARFMSDEAHRQEGMFVVYTIDDKYFFEIPDSLLSKDMLLGSRVSELSNSSKVVAGEMRRDPVLIRFTRDDNRVYLHQVVTDALSSPDDPVSIAVKRSNLDPILETFDIETLNEDSTAAVIDVTGFFSGEISPVSPFNAKYKAGKLESNSTFIKEALSFPKNIEVRTQMSYSNNSSDPFIIVMHRSILLLPEKPMRPRYEDRRIGYFTNSKQYFSTDSIGVGSLKYISRFDLRPAEADKAAYAAGELVEPEKPIVFYIDDAFPEEWKAWIKEGIEFWQKPFEAIGFKNAIVAKPYPKNEPGFHPEDIRYSCIRYIPMDKANSMGPRWIDPRSGEVIGGDVLWWHNVTELLRDWRFVQCAAAEPEARKRNTDPELLGQMIRYVAAHEVGHTLGLKHNMRASYAFPVDSLRSAHFTQKNGTTPSIMDYARFNYIAQPGDNGVRFTPPDMGPYDFYAIKWGYQPIPGAKTAGDEYETLNAWILEKAGDPVYQYGDQQMGAPCFDPASQNEALGDDAVKASTYGVKNARYIMDHLVDWATFENEDFDYLLHMYKELVKQYERYTGHVASYLGGVYIYNLVEGEDTSYYNPVSREKQQEALRWLFRELRTQSGWMMNPEIMKRTAINRNDLFKLQAEMLDQIMNGAIFTRLYLYHDDYTCYDYLSDLHKLVWEQTSKGKDPDAYERNLQLTYVRNLLAMGDQNILENGPESFTADAAMKSPNGSKTPSVDNVVVPLIHLEIERSRKLIKKHLNEKDPVVRAHYRYMYELLN